MDTSWLSYRSSGINIDHSIAVFARAYTGNSQIFTTYLLLTSHYVGGKVSSDQLHRISKYSGKSMKTIKKHLIELASINFVSWDGHKWFYGISQKRIKIMLEKLTETHFRNIKTSVPFEALENVKFWNRFLDTELVGSYVQKYKNKQMFDKICDQMASNNGGQITKSVKQAARKTLDRYKKSNTSSKLGVDFSLRYFGAVVFKDNQKSPSVQTLSKRLIECNHLGLIERRSKMSQVDIGRSQLTDTPGTYGYKEYAQFVEHFEGPRSLFKFKTLGTYKGQTYGKIMEWEVSTIHKVSKVTKYASSNLNKFYKRVNQKLKNLAFTNTFLVSLSSLMDLDLFLQKFSRF